MEMENVESSCSSSSDYHEVLEQTQYKFTSSLIENLLRRKDVRHEFKVIENNQKKCSSTAWSSFGFPARLSENGSYERIIGFASCFQCKTTYSFQPGGSGSTKHMLRHVCPKAINSSSNDREEGPLDKFMKPKRTKSSLTAADYIRIRDELTKWICSSVHPFTIINDPGLKNIFELILEFGNNSMWPFVRSCPKFHILGSKYHGDLNAGDFLFSPSTMANNVHRLAEQYRGCLGTILMEQADIGCLCLCPDLWCDKYRKINYLGITAVFVDKKFELISIDICCCEYEEVDKTGSSVLQVTFEKLK